MQTYVVEARRHEDGPWMPVTTVQDDLLADVERIVIDGPTPGDWRIRPEDPEPRHPVAPEPSLGVPKPSRWQRLRWWWTMRTAPKGRC